MRQAPASSPGGSTRPALSRAQGGLSLAVWALLLGALPVLAAPAPDFPQTWAAGGAVRSPAATRAAVCPGTVEGFLLDARRRPLARQPVDVRVRGYLAETGAEPPTEGLRVRYDDCCPLPSGREWREIAGEVVADANGRFQFAVPSGDAILTVAARGFIPQTRRVRVRPGARTAPLAFRMVPGGDPLLARAPVQVKIGALQGTLLGPDGAPAAQKPIYLFVRTASGEGPVRDDGPLDALLVVTDFAGHFSRQGLPAAEVLVTARAAGFGETRAARGLVPLGGRGSVQLRLAERSVRLAGRVMGQGSGPVPGARVFLYRVPRLGDDPTRLRSLITHWQGELPATGQVPGLLEHDLYCAVTDALGRYLLPDLDPGSYRRSVLPPGGEWCPLERGPRPLDPAGEENFTLERARALECTLLGPDGAPLADTEVRLAMAREGARGVVGSAKWGSTDAAGRVRMTIPGYGLARLWLKAPGFRRAEIPSDSVQHEGVAPVSVRLERGLTLRGRVLKPDGLPAEDALITCRQRVPSADDETVESVSAWADGSFQVSGLEPGSVFLDARAEGFAPRGVALRIPTTGGEPLLLRLPPSITLCGTVRDAGGKPLPAAYVSWELPGSAGGQGWGCVTGADGAYRIPGVPGGSVLLRADCPDYQGAKVMRGPEGLTDPVRLDLTLTAIGYGGVRGRLLGPDGVPLAGVRLRVCGENPEASPEPVTTDVDGAFAVDHLPPGSSFLSVLLGAWRTLQEPRFEIRPAEETRLAPVVIASAPPAAPRTAPVARSPRAPAP